jgi:hypothetical protein
VYSPENLIANLARRPTTRQRRRDELAMTLTLVVGGLVLAPPAGWLLAQNEAQAFLYAFDLLELDGTDLRREPLEVRKATLSSILRKSRPGVRLNEDLEHPEGDVVFQHACKMGLEGIVSKRLGSRYRSGRSPDWLKFKNPTAPAVKREAEEDWGR